MELWKRRLRREKPFFTRVFKKHRVCRILDTACGTGMHAIAFRDWGCHVIGADISEHHRSGTDGIDVGLTATIERTDVRPRVEQADNRFAVQE